MLVGAVEEHGDQIGPGIDARGHLGAAHGGKGRKAHRYVLKSPSQLPSLRGSTPPRQPPGDAFEPVRLQRQR